MDWFFAHAEQLTAVFGLLAAAWAFLVKLDRTYRRHLRDTLVSKDDFHRLEVKVDQIIELAFYRTRRRRVGSDRPASKTEDR